MTGPLRGLGSVTRREEEVFARVLVRVDAALAGAVFDTPMLRAPALPPSQKVSVGHHQHRGQHTLISVVASPGTVP